MKRIAMAAAALAAMVGVDLGATAAVAQPHTTVTRTTVVRHGPGWHRPHRTKVCRTVWVNHRRVRRCAWR